MFVIKLVPIHEIKAKIKSWSRTPDYTTYRVLSIPNKRHNIKISKLKEVVENLQKRYPDRNYYIRKVRIKFVEANMKGIKTRKPSYDTFYVVGRREPKLRGIPLYYSPKRRKLYVPITYVRRKLTLVGSILTFRLRDLGIRYTMGYSS